VEWVVSTAHAFCFARCNRIFFYAFVLAHVVTFYSKNVTGPGLLRTLI
jgi:hypothetical protein